MRNLKKRILLGLTIIVLLGTTGFFLGCKQKTDGGAATVSVTDIKLDKTTLNLDKGESGKLNATVLPANAANKNVTWVSDKPNIASVDQEGTVTAKAQGSAVITVTTQDGGKTASCTVTVIEVTVEVTGVTLDKTTLTLIEGSTGKLTVYIEPANATNKSVTWSSSNTEIAEVDQEGNLKAKTQGSTVITVTTQDGNKKAACIVTVESTPEQHTAVLTLSPDKKVIKITAKTKDGNSVRVIGCSETEFVSGATANLNAIGEKVILKGDIIELDCNNNNLTDLNIQGLTSLESLNCENNQLAALNVQGLTALQKLNCCKNKISALNLQGLISLKMLFCYSNELAALDLQGLTALQRINCSHNRLRSINVQGLTSLESLYCNNNELTVLDLQGVAALALLYCNNNNLTALNLQGATALTWLSCNYNKLESLDVQGLTVLKTVYCYGNKLSKDVFTKLFSDLHDYSKTSKSGKCYLYTEKTDFPESNYRGFTAEELKVIKNKKWKAYKIKTDGHSAEL